MRSRSRPFTVLATNPNADFYGASGCFWRPLTDFSLGAGGVVVCIPDGPLVAEIESRAAPRSGSRPARCCAGPHSPPRVCSRSSADAALRLGQRRVDPVRAARRHVRQHDHPTALARARCGAAHAGRVPRPRSGVDAADVRAQGARRAAVVRAAHHREQQVLDERLRRRVAATEAALRHRLQRRRRTPVGRRRRHVEHHRAAPAALHRPVLGAEGRPGRGRHARGCSTATASSRSSTSSATCSPATSAVVDDIHRRAADAGTTDRMHLHGFDTDVWPYLADADILLVPSRLEETFGNVAIEGAARGAPDRRLPHERAARSGRRASAPRSASRPATPPRSPTRSATSSSTGPTTATAPSPTRPAPPTRFSLERYRNAMAPSSSCRSLHRCCAT